MVSYAWSDYKTPNSFRFTNDVIPQLGQLQKAKGMISSSSFSLVESKDAFNSTTLRGLWIWSFPSLVHRLAELVLQKLS